MKDQTMQEMIENIVLVVYYTYFKYVTNQDTKQDLFQEAYLKAYSLLASGNYDPTMPLRNYIFTGVRNSMTNFMYHYKKDDMHVDLSELDKYDNVVGVRDTSYEINIKDVFEICSQYQMYGRYFENTINYLNGLGLTSLKYDSIGPLDDLMKNAIITEVLWSLVQKSNIHNR